MEGINKNYLKSSSLISKFDKNKNQTPNSIEIGYRVNMSVLPSTNLIFRFSQDACRTTLGVLQATTCLALQSGPSRICNMGRAVRRPFPSEKS